MVLVGKKEMGLRVWDLKIVPKWENNPYMGTSSGNEKIIPKWEILTPETLIRGHCLRSGPFRPASSEGTPAAAGVSEHWQKWPLILTFGG